MTHEVVEELADELERLIDLLAWGAWAKSRDDLRGRFPVERTDYHAAARRSVEQFTALRTNPPATGEVGELPADLPLFCLQAMKVQLATFGVEPACNADGAIAVASSQAAEIARLQAQVGTARGVIAAWESLPGPARYTAKEVQAWLVGPMTTAINVLRQALSGSNSDAG